MDLTRAALVKEIQSSREFLERSTRVLTESESSFVPIKTSGVMSSAQHLAHIAHTIEWFLEGAFRKEGFDMNFERHAAQVAEIKSIKDARAHVNHAYNALITALESKSDSDWQHPIAAGPIMGGEPRWHIISAVVDHTAHHRGALTVYSRLSGKVPLMPYMES
jgi:uncharacterized damage-inducible protein DinB